ncbi:unnamed protein product [Lepeophtheirus salmonis]|uniref:(salmon louse) hypothetical protein n=1 Tax=Lepeophtheirus salmonis TaxID=72036 RepID=A0A7R8CUQ7_LEPSM|nr:unnamed protein product [Lepeophtheirus salmonis]CAF2901058.1 unnamed protein product [Lepeophtheirus salmonis]
MRQLESRKGGGRDKLFDNYWKQLTRDASVIERAPSKNSRIIHPDYDNDESGLYRAKSVNPETRGAKEINDTSQTKINTPIELMLSRMIEELNACRKDIGWGLQALQTTTFGQLYMGSNTTSSTAFVRAKIWFLCQEGGQGKVQGV